MHFDALVRRSINYAKPKQTKARKRLLHESNLSSDSEDEPSEKESEAIEEFCTENAVANEGVCEEPDSEFERSNPLSNEEINTRHDMQMNSDEMSDLRRQVMDIQQQLCRQVQTAIEGATVPEPALAKPALFHGYENENVDRWLQRFKLYLTNRRVNPESDQAAIQLALHLQGPAESYYYNLPSDVQSSFRCLSNAFKERFSPAHRSLRLRQELSVRRQGSNESIEKYLADLNDKFSCLDLRDEDKLSYLIQGLRPDIQVDVLKKEPKTYVAAEDTARLIYSIQQSLTQRREDDISRIVLQERLPRSLSNTSPSNRESSASDQAVSAIIEQLHKNNSQREDSILTKLEALLANNSGKKSDEQKELTLFSKLSELLNKAQGSTEDSPKQLVEPLEAYLEPERRGTPDYKHEIQRMEAKLEEFFRRVDARINGLARRNQNSREEPPRQRTREGRPICYSCGRVGHVQQNCN